MYKEVFSLILLSSLLLTAATRAAATFTVKCPEDCSCDKKLATVECFNSNLQQIPETLSSETKVLNLLGSHNLSKIIGDNVFKNAGLINLKKLFLNSCLLETIESNAFKGLSSLKYLELYDNSLQTIHSNTFKELKEINFIDLSYNRIKSLESGLFDNLSFLKYIYLEYNEIYLIKDTAFQNLPSLSLLMLNNNQLESLNISAFGNLPSLIELSTYDNPWRCDCRLKTWCNWIRYEKNASIESGTQCAEPQELAGQYWTDRFWSNFSCELEEKNETVIIPGSGDHVLTAEEVEKHTNWPKPGVVFIILIVVGIVTASIAVACLCRCYLKRKTKKAAIEEGTQEPEYSYPTIPIMSFDATRELVTSGKRLSQQAFTPRVPPRPENEYDYAVPQPMTSSPLNPPRPDVYDYAAAEGVVQHGARVGEDRQAAWANKRPLLPRLPCPENDYDYAEPQLLAGGSKCVRKM